MPVTIFQQASGSTVEVLASRRFIKWWFRVGENGTVGRSIQSQPDDQSVGGRAKYSNITRGRKHSLVQFTSGCKEGGCIDIHLLQYGFLRLRI